jgi:hypothetical protein
MSGLSGKRAGERDGTLDESRIRGSEQDSNVVFHFRPAKHAIILRLKPRVPP